MNQRMTLYQVADALRKHRENDCCPCVIGGVNADDLIFSVELHAKMKTTMNNLAGVALDVNELLQTFGEMLQQVSANDNVLRLMNLNPSEAYQFGEERTEALQEKLEDACETPQEKRDAWAAIMVYAFLSAMQAEQEMERNNG